MTLNIEQYSPGERAQIRFHEMYPGRLDLWKSLINESNLKNKENFLNAFNIPLEIVQTTSVSHYLGRIRENLYTAAVHSDNIPVALALYKNLEADIEEFINELYA